MKHGGKNIRAVISRIVQDLTHAAMGGRIFLSAADDEMELGSDAFSSMRLKFLISEALSRVYQKLALSSCSKRHARRIHV